MGLGGLLKKVVSAPKKAADKVIDKATDVGIEVGVKIVDGQLSRNKEYGDVYQKIKTWLNGKKTFLGVAIVSAPIVLEETRKVLEAAGIPPAKVATWVGGALAVIGLIDKGRKLAVKWGLLEA